MTQKKTITVFGATGAQGGGLVQAIHDDPNSEYTVRAVTRNTGSDKAKALLNTGIEVVEADIDDLQSIINALKGSYGAYFVTFYWEHFSPEKELEQAHNLADAAADVGLEHVIWSTLEDVRKWIPLNDDSMPTLQGKYKVPHFDSKGEANQRFIDNKVPTTFMMASFYWENMIYFGMGPQKGEDGKYAISLPIGTKKLAGIASDDIGKCAYGIFKHGKEMIGKTIGIAGEQLTGQEMADKLTQALGQEVKYNELTPEHYRNLGFPGSEDIGNMFQFYRDFEDYFQTGRDVNISMKLNPELKSFDEWLRINSSRFPLD